MCGLIGVIGRPTHKAKSVFHDLLQLDVVRGADSTGIAAIGPGKSFILKNTMLPQFLLGSEKYKKHVAHNYSDYHVMMGHNRLATRGKVVKRNAHPFTHGSITLMHNGTLYKHLPSDDNKFDTDSESIAYYINKHGIETAWKLLDGPAAITFWDRKDQTLNIITNGQRPMYIVRTTDREQVLWASERWMLEAAAERNRININGIVSPKANWLFQFSYDDQKKEVENITHDLTPKFKSSPNTTFHQHGTYRSRMINDTSTRYLERNIHNEEPKYPDCEISDGVAEAAEQFAAAMSAHTGYSVDKSGEKGPVNLNSSSPAGSGTQLIKDVRFISFETHRYDPVKNEMVPRGSDEKLAALGEKIAAALRRSNNKGTLFLPKGQPSTSSDKDLASLRKKTMSQHEFEENFHDCVSCDESLQDGYETAIVVGHHEAICESCVSAAMNDGLSVQDVINSTK